MRKRLSHCRPLLLVIVSAVLAVPAPASGAPPRTTSSDGPIGAHSMLYLNTPFGAKQAMFAQAAAMGASEIRVDIELSAVFPVAEQPPKGSSSPLAGLPVVGRPAPQGPNDAPTTHPDWSGVDQYLQLARRYHLRVLADLTSTPSYMADCPAGTPRDQAYRCAPKDPGQWARAAGEIAAHTRGVIDDFEIINEPDGGWSFLGSPGQYAVVLAAAHDAIHVSDPGARVVLGGIMDTGPQGQQWMDAVLDTPGADAIHKFDVANIHVRGLAAQAGADVCQWRSYLAERGFAGPLWVTETGYPADSAQQFDPAFRGGALAQARWLSEAIPAMLAAGSARIFVTERDWGSGPYASEGVLQTPDPLTASPSVKRRLSFYVVQRLARAGRAADLRSLLRRSSGPNWGSQPPGAGCSAAAPATPQRAAPR